jgi:curved DNA-binding protein
MKDYYKILGVDRAAADTEIKNAYRRLAKKYHPDVSKEEDATQKFQEIQEAYSVLKDPQKKAAYDNPNPQGRIYEHYQTNGGFDPLNNIHDLFEALRGHGYQRRRQQIFQITITLEEAYSGTVRQINGTTFRIPPGLRTGNRISVEDFLVDVIVLPHGKYKRAGDDLLVAVSITAIEAMAGTKAVIKNIDGTSLRCDISPGIQPGQILRIKGKGMPNPEVSSVRGDLLVQINISIPTNLTDEQKERIIEIGYRPEVQA